MTRDISTQGVAIILPQMRGASTHGDSLLSIRLEFPDETYEVTAEAVRSQRVDALGAGEDYLLGVRIRNVCGGKTAQLFGSLVRAYNLRQSRS